MPRVSCKGLTKDEVKGLSLTISPAFAALIGAEPDWITFTYEEPIGYCCGELLKFTPTIDIAWFDRGQELQDKTATLFDKAIRELGYTDIDIVFHLLEKSKYYENGTHL